MKIEIKCRFSGSVLFYHDVENNTIKLTVEASVKAGAYLTGADLAGADLAGAYLTGADLGGANLDGETLTSTPISITNLHWPVLITQGYMRIGCKRFTHSEWADFDNAQIAEMDDRALVLWNKWKVSLLAMCDAIRGEA